ncbi:MAG: HD domain-containing protein [Desulfuromonadaceae bacterium]|jgi:tRNA nucleotidyltransferase (CCA-adding enzyme)|nr:HD domain-containing protein [Desulfuromonadaceae bacterium]
MTATSIVKSLFPQDAWSKIWIVGGTVRDVLNGKDGEDIDLDAVLTPEELASYGFRPVDPVTSAPIWFRHIPEIGKIEITRLSSVDLLADDLTRRDFTVNALAMTLDGDVVDLFGGIQDLEQKRLRACSPVSFQDDPIRIFRAFRFESEEWRMTPETTRMISDVSWERSFTSIPVERFSREMVKALGKGEPERFFRNMAEKNVGSTYLPELFAMNTVPAGPIDKHPEGDLLTHSLQVLQRTVATSDDPLARFCALFHDLGKLETDPALYPKHHGHDDAGKITARKFCDRLCLPASWRRALIGTCQLHTNANNWHELRDSTRIRMADQAVKSGIIEILPLVSAADKPCGSGMAGWETTVRVVQLNTAELGIDQDILEAMPVENRAGFILQKRIDQLRRQI